MDQPRELDKCLTVFLSKFQQYGDFYLSSAQQKKTSEEKKFFASLATIYNLRSGLRYLYARNTQVILSDSELAIDYARRSFDQQQELLGLPSLRACPI